MSIRHIQLPLQQSRPLCGAICALLLFATAAPALAQRTPSDWHSTPAHRPAVSTFTAADEAGTASDSSQLRLRPVDESATNRNLPESSRWSWVESLGSLALVLAMLFAATWLLRRFGPRGSGPLPLEVLEVLGRQPLAGRQQLALVRVGTKLSNLVRRNED